jgi:SNF2 domain-containing protein/helicase-like protein
MTITLTENQLEAAQDYLDSLDNNTRRRGDKYFLEKRVGDLDPYKRGIGFRANVAGGQDYRVKLRFEDSKWDGECACPVGFDCKHCCAAMLKVLAEADAIPDPDEQPQPAVPEAARRAQARGPAAALKPVTGNDRFSTILRARLGRKLKPDEERAANAVDSLFSYHRSARLIGESLLEPITGQRAGWGWNTVQVWPTEPRTPWETWLFVAAFLRRTQRPCRQGLLDATDWAEVDALVSDWDRREQVEKWRGWLQERAQKFEAGPPETAELRVRLTDKGAQLESRKPGAADFAPVRATAYTQFVSRSLAGRLALEGASLAIWRVFNTGYGSGPLHEFGSPDTMRVLNQLLRLPGFEDRVVAPSGEPMRRADETLQWRVEPAASEKGDYRFALALPDGSTPPPALTVLDGEPSLYVTRDTVFPGPPLGDLRAASGPVAIPAEALETSEGVALLDQLRVAPPPRLAGRVRTVRMRVVFRCEVQADRYGSGERLIVTVRADPGDGGTRETYLRDGWKANGKPAQQPGILTRYDRSALPLAPALVESLRVNWDSYGSTWHRQIGKHFPAQLSEWLAALPQGVEVELDPLLASLRDKPIEARVKLDVEEAGIDWFDLRVALDVADTNLTPEEIRALLDARGGFVRLGAKGWRRLQFQLSEEDEKQLADLGLNARDFSSEPQRLHALQLAGKKAATRLLSAPQAQAIERRATEIQTRVAPDVPAGLRAELRPYQVTGFHFLAYLSTNRFGGILADDMGLGKTVQSLAWLLWLRENGAGVQPVANGKSSATGKMRAPLPTLVVCPKSVTDNWAAEAARFAPGLRVHALTKGSCDAAALESARAAADLVVVNYTQLRLLEPALTAAPWHAVILDEAQYIKNPESQTARAAWALRSAHRLALSGTPIENRLLDLWSIMGFAMPGVLGQRATFSKTFDQRTDPLARRRLAARVRPFVLRRTKSEVAKDLPERIEEDLRCELEGEQATLYRAELKRARAALLKIGTKAELDKQRFNVLTSLLRLRQICCHPALVSAKAREAESAKLNALLDLLEPLVAEGHKVLVFSQFVEMLAIIRAEVERREWRHFVLTGDTEDRGPLVDEFQRAEGSAVFLISLRAGGFGLNLTAASYVVLYDPWWNPAVENQAIDRTHRIGQTSHVIAYRLLVKESIEEKIRLLQKQKRALAEDILGEETFARGLTLDDFRFLFAE